MHRFSLIGLLGGFLAVGGAAQDRPVVTEAEFLSVLDETHPAVRESAEAVGLAEARLLAARTFDNPVVEAVREDPAGPIGQTDILVSWQIPDAARGPEIRAREGEIGAARRRLAYDLLGYRLAMREAYAGWAVAAARRQRLSTQAERVESLAQREAVRAEGEKPRVSKSAGSGWPPPRCDPASPSLTGRANGPELKRRPGTPACRLTRGRFCRSCRPRRRLKERTRGCVPPKRTWPRPNWFS